MPAARVWRELLRIYLLCTSVKKANLEQRLAALRSASHRGQCAAFHESDLAVLQPFVRAGVGRANGAKADDENCKTRAKLTQNSDDARSAVLEKLSVSRPVAAELSTLTRFVRSATHKIPRPQTYVRNDKVH